LTIKFTLDTEYCQRTTGLKPVPLTRYRPPYIGCTAAFCNFVVARQYSIVKDLFLSPRSTQIKTLCARKSQNSLGRAAHRFLVRSGHKLGGPG